MPDNTSIVEDVNSIILRMDTEGRITFFNRFACDFFGYGKSEISGKNVIGTIVPLTDSAGASLSAMIKDIMVNPGKYVNNENENILRDGRRVWISWTNRAILGDDGRAKEIICVGNDITKIKQAEDALKEMDRRKSDFVANVSHEFKNPLATIRESLSLVLQGITGEVSAEQKAIIEVAKKNVERLIRLVTDLLDISKIEAGKMHLKRERIEIGPLVDEIAADNAAEISKKEFKLTKNIPPDLGALYADKDKITQVVINLLSNAIKYTLPGGTILIKCEDAGKEIRFEVFNSGPGITKENMDKLFNKFERITAEKQEGTGLGLAISRDIIVLHKGKIWVESEPGKGAKFIFTLPKDLRN